MKKICVVNILGTDYTVCLSSQKTDEVLKSSDAYCDNVKRVIVLSENIRNNYIRDHVLNHEIVHAFLHQSGLRGQGNSDWAVNEETVDWIASMINKMHNVSKQSISNLNRREREDGNSKKNNQ